ncbi:CotY/CotZ family spore coat protein [Piscibacillus halophilus]|uniref:Spore coat protein Z n=1 Tax=Piscibacillus halophilus TaxID=571933 RepID=A0A1H9D5G2_9BACI|nr:CotY/CotZ family spore coat protein [Piscibacillus halophilus]SEQ08093.1 Spore coat protein Z [Piscibacillus halophilus]
MFEDDFTKDLDCKNNKCVCKTVAKIAAAQDEVADRDRGCDTGCKQSVKDLLSPTAQPNGDNDTVPFILYCKGDCGPFIGQSVVTNQVGMDTVFNCLETPIFRVSKVKKDCCAELELLLPVTEGGSTPGPGGDDVCDFFPGNSIRNFQRTGVCITVDLCEFLAIACLDPVRSLPVSEWNCGGGGGGAASRNHD